MRTDVAAMHVAPVRIPRWRANSKTLDLVSSPIVDEEHKLIGRITIDDVVDVIRDEG